MKLLMACDDYIYCHNGIYYAANLEKLGLYMRYLHVFSSMRLITRCKEEKELKPGRVMLDERIEFIPLPFFQGPLQYVKNSYKIHKVLYDVVNGCDAAVLRLPSTTALHVAHFVNKTNIPYATEIVYSAHDGYLYSHNLIQKILWKIIDLKMRKICYQADGVSCVTEFVLQKYYYSKKQDAFYSHYSSLDLPKKFYTHNRPYPTKDKFVICHVSNQIMFNGRKGHKIVLLVVKLLKDLGMNVNVRFAGEDYMGGIYHLKKMAQDLGVSDQIDFLGYITKDELSDLLDTSDLFFMPTKSEGLPRVIIEAMAKGLPCVSTNVSGNIELLKPEYLFSYDDVHGMANKIFQLLTFKELYEQASSECFNDSLKYESSSLQIRRDEFYLKLLTRI